MFLVKNLARKELKIGKQWYMRKWIYTKYFHCVNMTVVCIHNSVFYINFLGTCLNAHFENIQTSNK